MASKKIESALISVFHKEGLEPIVAELKRLGVTIYSTGGTQGFIESLGAEVTAVEDLTSYPSILDGRVKTLHPKVFGGILARREESHLSQLGQYEIPAIDLVIVDLYPFEQTVAATDDEAAIIEKIDIGGISLIRAAAKNYKDVAVVPSQSAYAALLRLLKDQDGVTTLADRQALAREAFMVSSHYDTAIFNYFNREEEPGAAFKHSIGQATALRYGENPHQAGVFYGNLEDMFDIIGGKALSYNNLVDIDAAVGLVREFKGDAPTFAILKHTNSCGVATRPTILEAWKAALAADNVSAFGGILMANATIDRATAEEIDNIFYEVLIAPGFDEDALELLTQKKKRILLRIKDYAAQPRSFKSLLNGVIEQDTDLKIEAAGELTVVTQKQPTPQEVADLLFANKCAKHLKSNTIVLARGQQLLSMGCGQTSRVDALKQAIEKAKAFGFSLEGAVMASDAFFPFPDCVEIADTAGITAVIQPGGSIRDKDSVAYCDAHGMAMVTTGIRHFKH
ncbi:bifunctional phosphoribosylaminoimidazolecarboxamide formyltransferase/IMP cyclohydrolase [Phaeodactylibacter luteus]|uniref:Bifunctional purine biosynthesis protein PurH n=1 Tax=Phaeodactylibacter luteus TaxID=1564516 RepID=A0A5C6RZJ8_9BACT|nr:bifunctional phosphoribosylaminoimidazolecarboxamide formyltransferase/IMP cyclohydrolase [Phaeodactylibacter luteus]TXB67583.1 bifunctional phosphoribosylaminoimidazolecarboxamide formyltransferase/IMP cyclohydrolase [Phaeodactylibacter luteus]